MNELEFALRARQADMTILVRLLPAALVAAFMLLLASAALAQAPEHQPLIQRLTPEVMAIVYPDAGRLGPEEGSPPAIAVYEGEEVAAYIFSTLDVIRAPGYSGAPFDVIAGVRLDGTITGAAVIYNREPHIYADPIREAKLDDFLARQAGTTYRGDGEGPRADFVAGATVSARLMRAAIHDSARLILNDRLGRPVVTEPTLDLETMQTQTFPELVASGAVASRIVTNRELEALLPPGAVPESSPAGGPDDTYIEIVAALADPASIGRNLLHPNTYDTHVRQRPEGTNVIFVASRGRYDFVGNGYYREENGFLFDRLRVVQGDRVFAFVKTDMHRAIQKAKDMGTMQYASVFEIAPDKGFDPLQPWRLDLVIHATLDSAPVEAVVPIEYRLPENLILLPEPEPIPPWVEAWRLARPDLIVLGIALGALTLILAFQAKITRMRRAHRFLRNGFLVFVLVWLGWYAGGQLSIIHVANYAQAAFRGFDIGFYLAEPLIVVVALYALVGVLLIGRGVFCGWLCPFGALQELLAQVARALRLPQWNPSDALNRRLWLGKYIAAPAVIALAFVSPEAGNAAAEIEPFKTAITSVFERGWPYVFYAAVILSIGLFTERAFCRFLCPLGGVFAILDRLHLLNLLKRRPECGNPCQLCSRSCPVKAIERSGKIRMSECFQCLDCQVEYYDDRRCPPLVRAGKLATRQRKQRPAALPVGA